MACSVGLVDLWVFRWQNSLYLAVLAKAHIAVASAGNHKAWFELWMEIIQIVQLTCFSSIFLRTLYFYNFLAFKRAKKIQVARICHTLGSVGLNYF